MTYSSPDLLKIKVDTEAKAYAEEWNANPVDPEYHARDVWHSTLAATIGMYRSHYRTLYEEYRRVTAERDKLMARVEVLERKAEHGCSDTHCDECDPPTD